MMTSDHLYYCSRSQYKPVSDAVIEVYWQSSVIGDFMAKELVFKLGENEFPFGIRKLDRKKLYGWKEVVAVDKDNNECIKATLDETGSFVIPKGGTALCTIDKDGNWPCPRSANDFPHQTNRTGMPL